MGYNTQAVRKKGGFCRPGKRPRKNLKKDGKKLLTNRERCGKIAKLSPKRQQDLEN